jgi:16S rRNA (uracil1498-N3)-methyltransferase
VNCFIAVIEGASARLTEEESWHCAKVLRKRSGDDVILIDGSGRFFPARLTLVHEKRCEAVITAEPRMQTPRGYRFHLAIAPTKQIDRIEWMVEKAVEIGIDEISFIQCKNSERVSLKTDRIRKVAESAVKQSLQAFIPVVNELQLFDKFVAGAAADRKLIAHCEESPKRQLKDVEFRGLSTLVLIGPEGDFSSQEISAAVEKGFEAVALGPTRLRTETAGLYALQCAAILA